MRLLVLTSALMFSLTNEIDSAVGIMANKSQLEQILAPTLISLLHLFCKFLIAINWQ
jgi:hypothetical protein